MLTGAAASGANSRSDPGPDRTTPTFAAAGIVLAAVAAAVAAADSTVMHCNYAGADCTSPWIYFLCYEIWGISANPPGCGVATREAKCPSLIDSALACTDSAADADAVAAAGHPGSC